MIYPNTLAYTWNTLKEVFFFSFSKRTQKTRTTHRHRCYGLTAKLTPTAPNTTLAASILGDQRENADAVADVDWKGHQPQSGWKLTNFAYAWRSAPSLRWQPQSPTCTACSSRRPGGGAVAAGGGWMTALIAAASDRCHAVGKHCIV